MVGHTQQRGGEAAWPLLSNAASNIADAIAAAPPCARNAVRAMQCRLNRESQLRLQVPTMSLTVGVGTVMDAREVVIIISGVNKATPAKPQPLRRRKPQGVRQRRSLANVAV
jgi:hypothetical protein